MRNVFDQYDQPENKLTHALVSTLHHDRSLLRPFLRRLGLANVPPVKALQVVEQQVPGDVVGADDGQSQGLPDACVYTDDGWAVLVECKVQAGLTASQLHRHRRTAERHGFPSPHLVTITVDRPKGKLPAGTLTVLWREVYEWFGRQCGRSQWAPTFVEYMQVFEAKMLAAEYNIQGTLTMFDGIRFDTDNPYTYREGKRLLRLLGQELRGQRGLVDRPGIDPKGPGRGAIKGRGRDSVWDFIPLKAAKNAKLFTDCPHVTMSIRQHDVVAAVTIPSGVRGGFRRRLKEMGLEGFRQLVATLQRNLRPVVRRSAGAKPILYLCQQHFLSQSGPSIPDGRLEFDLRAAVRSEDPGPKYQPMWIEAAYGVLTHKRTNIQCGVEVRFQHTCPVVRSPKLAGLFAEAWAGLTPLIDFVLDKP